MKGGKPLANVKGQNAVMAVNLWKGVVLPGLEDLWA